MYVQYLRRDYPHLDVEHVLQEAGITLYQIEDPAHWFCQEEVDRLHEVLVRHTGEQGISRSVGRFAASSEGLGAAKQYMLGLMSPATVYQRMEKHYPLMSRGATITARQKSPASVEITSVPKPGVSEKAYQCENRSGIFEALAQWFTGHPAAVEHPECFHRGDPHCRYIVSWEESGPYLWRRIRNASLVLGVLGSAVLYPFSPISGWMTWNLLSLLTLGLCAYQTERSARKALTLTVEQQRKAAETSLLESETRYNNALLVQELGQATSTLLDIEALITAVMNILQRRLSYDRGLIMLADRAQGVLRYAAGYGHTQAQEAILRETTFDIDKPSSKGLFIAAMRERRPYLVEDVGSIESDLSTKSLEFARRLDSHSLICVPIVYEREALGILAVDNSTSRALLTQSDLNLLTGVAAQLATSIVNARSFERIRSSETQYRDLVETASSLILRTDGNGRIAFVNAYAQRFFGCTEADMVGQDAAAFILPAGGGERPELDEFVASMSRDPMRPAVRDGETRLRSGKTAWIAWTYRPIFDDSGKFRELLCIGNDFTELKWAEQERGELQAQLQRAQKMEAIGTLAGGVAHDLNNILSGIVSYPELLLMDLPEESALRKPILTIQKSGEKAAAIVQDLLTLARRGVETTEVVNLNQIVADYLASPEFSRLELNHPGLTVTPRLDDRLLNIIGSPVHLSKTVMNLVTNAAEAMPEGGEVVIRTENRHLERKRIGYGETLQGDFVALTVCDTGVGISPEDMERIFEPFYTKKAMGRSGTGLGMAVVWGTVQDHRGHIDMQSHVGRGTDITLYFPVTRRQAALKQERRSLATLQGRGETVLVVDDLGEQREIATEMLSKLGYTVATADGGEAAVEWLGRQSADLVVLDMIMDPGIDGLETFKRILELRPGQKTIIASGYSESVSVREARRMGAGAYVKKPYLLETLGRAVRAELDK
jgi:PAS domain S-box-containing protein